MNGAPRWLWLLGGGVALGYAAVEGSLLSGTWGLPLDDGWIHLAFARSLAGGDGLALQPGGGLVAASTSPLWTALLALLFLLPGPDLLWAKLAGVTCYLGAGTALFRLGRDLGLGRGLAGLAAAFLLATSWMAWSALSGMEISLFCWLSLLAVRRHLAERRGEKEPPVSFLLFGLATLARPEGALLLLLAALDRLLVWRGEGEKGRGLRLAAPTPRPVLLGLAAAACLLVPTALAFWWLGGSPLPTTFGAKAGGLRLPVPSGRLLYTVLGVCFQPLPILTLLAGAGVVRLVERLGSGRCAGLLPALWPLGLPLAYGALAGPGTPLVGNFGLYFFPLIPFVLLLGVLGLDPAAHRLGSLSGAGPRRLGLRAVFLALLLVPTLWTLTRGAARYAQNVANVEDSDVRLARWVRETLPAEAKLAVQDVGALGYLAPNPLVDLSGLVTPAVQKVVRRASTPEDPRGEAGMRRFLAEEKPDFVIVYPPWYPALQRDPSLLRPVHRIEIPANITMAGDRLVVYATPWTREVTR